MLAAGGRMTMCLNYDHRFLFLVCWLHLPYSVMLAAGGHMTMCLNCDHWFFIPCLLVAPSVLCHVGSWWSHDNVS